MERSIYKSKRLEYLDMIKGFGILLVILGHAYPVNNIRIWIHSFHMPLFYIISGCIFYHTNTIQKNIKGLIKSKLMNLLIPYLTFNIVYILINYLLSKFSLDVLYHDIETVILLNGIVALWFLPSLFICECTFILLKKIITKDSLVIILISFLFTLSLFIPSVFLNSILLVMYRSFIGLGFFAFGYYLFKYIKELEINYFIIILMLFVNILLSEINGFVNLFQLRFNNIVLYLICSLLGSLTIILLMKKIRTIKFLTYFGKNSLIILCTHQCIMSFFRVISGNDLTGYVSGFILFILTIIIEIPIIEIINRYIPFIIGKSSNHLNLNKKLVKV